MARQTNHAKTKWVMDSIVSGAQGTGSPIMHLGLAYKPGIDDLRMSPPLEVLDGPIITGFSDIMVVESYIDACRKPVKVNQCGLSTWTPYCVARRRWRYWFSHSVRKSDRLAGLAPFAC